MKCPSCGNNQATCVISNYWDCPSPGCKNYSGTSGAKSTSKSLTAIEFDRPVRKSLPSPGWYGRAVVYPPLYYGGKPTPLAPAAPTNPNWPPHIPQFDMTTHVWTGYSTSGLSHLGNTFICVPGRIFYRTPVEAFAAPNSNNGRKADCIVCVSGIDGDAVGWHNPGPNVMVGIMVWKGIP